MVTVGVRRIVVMALFLFLFLSWSLAPSSHASETPARTRRLRVLPPCAKNLIEDATAQSSTIRALATRIEQSDLIVFIRCLPFKDHLLAGRMVFLTSIAGQRYLVIELKSPEQWNTQVATVAHELQHAVEVANEPSVRNQATMAQYYRRTGVTISSRPLIFDTEAARQTGLRVQRELAMPPALPGPEAERQPQR